MPVELFQHANIIQNITVMFYEIQSIEFKSEVVNYISHIWTWDVEPDSMNCIIYNVSKAFKPALETLKILSDLHLHKKSLTLMQRNNFCLVKIGFKY